jgi:tripartite-type tricarboxylate transporter receptor subunit TctC
MMPSMKEFGSHSMPMPSLRFAALTVALTTICALQICTPASAQDYPNKPIRVVVPFPPGGPTDGMARIVSDRLGKLLGQTIVVDNRGGGAGGSVGAKSVAAADPDGYTILMTPGGS